MRPKFSIRAVLVVICIIAFTVALLRERYSESTPVYLHVYGTMVDPEHDDYCVDHPVVSADDRPWIRIATVAVYDRRPFGFHTPNQRRPAIGISGKLSSTLGGRYVGKISWLLDDANLTFDYTESVDLSLNTIVYIDESYDMYLLSRDEDPYEALLQSIREDDPSAHLADKL